MESRQLPSISPVCTTGVCVVIPAFNEEALVGRCIASLLTAGLDPAQIVVVDDCSSDRTREVLDEFPGISVVVNTTRLGKIRGIQRAIGVHGLSARFEFLAVLDADSYVDPLYFDAVVRAFRANPDAVLVCGSPRSDRGNWITAYRAVEYSLSDWIYRPGQHALGVITVAPGCASTYRTSILPMLEWDGGTLVEDMDLTVQVHRKRLGGVVHVRDAVSHTQDPRRIADYVGQVTRWYSGAWQVMRLHRIPFGKQRIDGEFVLVAGEGLVYSALMLLLPLFALASPRLIAGWLLVDQLVLIAAAAACAIKYRRPDVLFCSPAYVVLRAINSFLWIKTFWTEIVRGDSLTVWFTPKRYQHGARTKVLACSREAIRA